MTNNSFFSSAYAIANNSTKDESICIICCTDKTARRLVSALQILCGKNKNIAYLPSPQTLLFEQIEPSPSIIAKRLETLFYWQIKKIDIIVMSISTYSRPLANPSYLGKNCLKLKPGDIIVPNNLRNQLISWGYEYADYVCDPGTFALRGAIIDLFPFNSKSSFRIELFDNSIENIYLVHGDNINIIPEISIFPSREYELTDDTINKFRITWQKNFGLWGQKSELYQRTVSKKIYSGIHEWLSWLYDGDCYWDNYLQADQTYLEPGYNDSYIEQLLWAEKYHQSHKNDSREPIMPVTSLIQNLDKLASTTKPWPKNIDNKSQTGVLKLFTSKHNAESDAHINSGKFIDCNGDLLSWLNSQPKGYFTLQSDLEAQEMIAGILIESVHLQKKTKPVIQSEKPINGDLAIGSYIVHNKHGIGRLSKIEIFEHAGEKYDCLVIEYAEQGRVLIPTTELDQISKFKTIVGDSLQLSKLGKKSWQRKQDKIIRSIQDDAVMLMQLQAHRKKQNRPLYNVDQEKFANFLNRFPFEDTNDQKQITEVIIQDLTNKAYPMDRLICGDVGFGKTEIALRACWIAVNNGKQVIWLAPTTVLAKQHAMRLRERYLDDCFSILESIGNKIISSEHKQDLANGTIDILVGTHGVLSNKFKFANLGLLIIDEEHKFGVKQKDSIVLNYPAVDILSLSATPIPRSLNMAMSSLRDISLLASAPPERLDVKTITGLVDDDELIKQAIFREIQRGGQIYFCYNRIDRLPEMSTKISSWFPKVQIGIVHGQMYKVEIEQVMQDFSVQKLDILMCSSIIESGIDYANANTLIVYRADLFGLSQLHQLRGRVGRAKQQAYAYLLLPDKAFQTKDCQNRIQAIESHSKLGSGFSLAIEDLEIRGAGSLLGKQQSGHILDIGFEYYQKLLSQTMKWLESNPGKILDIEELLSGKDFNYILPFSLLIPDNYILEPNERLRCYQELANCQTHEAIDDLSNSWLRRYGAYPLETANLIDISHIKLDLLSVGANTLRVDDSEVEITFNPGAITEAQIIKIASMPHKYLLRPPAQIVINYSNDSNLRLLIATFCHSILA